MKYLVVAISLFVQGSTYAQIDSAALIKLFGESHFKKSLHQYRVLAKSFDSDSNFQITYFSKDIDSTSEDFKFSTEYRTYLKESIIASDLNKDGEIDFTYKYISGPVYGNAYYFVWNIAMKTHGHSIIRETPFGGGKFGDIEEIISIENGIVTTEFFEFDMEIGWHSGVAIIKKYKYVDGEFVELSTTND